MKDKNDQQYEKILTNKFVLPFRANIIKQMLSSSYGETLKEKEEKRRKIQTKL